MNFTVLTLFTDMIKNCMSTSIMGRAVENGLISCDVVDIRDFAENKHNRVDDYPYGGGAGMVMEPGPVYRACEYAKKLHSDKRSKIIYLSPIGKPFTQEKAKELSKEESLIFLCGHYEGIDERVLEFEVDEYISLGDFVLPGGELPALAVMDAVSRLVPGVLNNDESAGDESFEGNTLEYPQYTRPEEFMGKRVPDVLLSGHHANIARYRREKSLIRTMERRPDLFEKVELDKKDKKVLKEYEAGKHKLFVKEMIPGVYLLDEAHGATGYLVVGEDRACVIDTMCAETNLGEEVRKLTDKPVFVINTHGHPDHIYGNVYFEEIYIHPADIPMAEEFYQEPLYVEGCKKAGATVPPFKTTKGGDTFDLGGRTLEIYELPGHTPGGILVLLKEDRILFTGDSINHHLWMMLDGCPPMEEYVKALDNVMFLEEKADRILHGHAQDFDDISLMRCLRQAAVEICEGKTENDPPYHWFGGVARQHPFKHEPGKEYAQIESVICYNKE